MTSHNPRRGNFTAKKTLAFLEMDISISMAAVLHIFFIFNLSSENRRVVSSFSSSWIALRRVAPKMHINPLALGCISFAFPRDGILEAKVARALAALARNFDDSS